MNNFFGELRESPNLYVKKKKKNKKKQTRNQTREASRVYKPFEFRTFATVKTAKASTRNGLHKPVVFRVTPARVSVAVW